MTRKTRTRRPRVQSLQSGYCEICHIPYNSIEDHIQSKRHQKLIGEDAGYIAINGFLNPDANIGRFLNLNIDTTLANGTLEGDLSPRLRRRNMRTRAASVISERPPVKPSPLSPAHSEIIVGHHHLRSRRNINYMTPPLDDDSLTEADKAELSPPPPPPVTAPPTPPPAETANRELRSSARVQAKLIESQEKHDEVWNSGRPKRSCISRQRRTSTDERLLAENAKTYYKVEVLSSKLRQSQTRELEISKQCSKGEDEKEKGLIVKFKKLRNSELVQLNNEATNFLFPTKKEESSEEDEGDPDADGANTTASTGKINDSTLLMSSEEEELKSPAKVKVEDDASMDSVSSDGKKLKKKRRTHAEAFIMDNHKYYKFEMPGSRLRYQGTFMPPSGGEAKTPRSNGDLPSTETKVEKEDVEEEKPPEKKKRLCLSDYKFSFERVPRNEQWYDTFRRQDTGEMRYPYYSDFFWDSFILPYQMGPIPPLDPKKCLRYYSHIKQLLADPPSSSCTSGGCTTPDPSAANSTSSLKDGDCQDEDSKTSMATTSSSSTTDDVEQPTKKRSRRNTTGVTQTVGRNPRKSPRQHASTLAILSSIIQQRKRKSKSVEKQLPVIDEEVRKSPSPVPPPPEEVPKVERREESPRKRQQKVIVCSRKPRAARRKPVVKVDYNLIASKIEDEINTTLEEDENFEEIDIEPDSIDIKDDRVNAMDILSLYDAALEKEDERTTRRFFNGTPGRKPGRRKKKNNKTGWPNKNRRQLKREFTEVNVKEDEEEEGEGQGDENSAVDSGSEKDSADEEDAHSTDSIKKPAGAKCDETSGGEIADANVENAAVAATDDCDDDRVEAEHAKETKETNEVTQVDAVQYQPYVCVQKLASDKITKDKTSPKRTTSRRQRRMPGSPKSPRMLRKPRGRWYRER